MKQEKIVAQVALAMAEINSGDAKRIDHALKVFAHAQNIGRMERLEGEVLFGLELAALLHDIGIRVSEEKYGSSNGKYQEKEGPAIARQILTTHAISNKVIERVCFLIGHHHTYSAIDGVDFQILVESDFLVNAVEEPFGESQIESAAKRLFQTESGQRFLKQLYPWI